jgi:hypothetical protein
MCLQACSLTYCCFSMGVSFAASYVGVLAAESRRRWVAGQERQEVPGAGHLACTIEMADLGRHVDVAVIDEIQVCRHINTWR